jgi:lipoprotein-anchoring transpeptidase ErfK/SrfK
VTRVTKVAAAGIVAAACAGTIAYGAVSTVGSRSTISVASSQVDGVAPARTTDERASRSTGYCGRTGPGQARVENYLQTQTTRFGQVIVDAKQDSVDCVAIKKFQTSVGLAVATGFADEQTAEVADRLARSAPASCHAAVSATTVCVDLTHQTLWVTRGGSVIFSPTVIRSGAKGLVTPSGDFAVIEKKQVTISSEYGTPLPYWERFYADFGIHATNASLYGTADPGSHGCVNMLSSDAQKLYSLTRVGTPVHVFGHKANT